MRNSIKGLSAFTFHNSAEATETITITDNLNQRGHTAGVISAKDSTFMGRLWEVIVNYAVMIGIVALIVVGAIFFVFLGTWLLMLIIGILLMLTRYILHVSSN